MKIDLLQRKDRIPRSAGGDPRFLTLEDCLTVFSREEVVELVNRALYSLEYQREVHRKRGQAERDRLKPLRLKLKQLFNVSLDKASPQQLLEAKRFLEKEATGS